MHISLKWYNNNNGRIEYYPPMKQKKLSDIGNDKYGLREYYKKINIISI